MCRLFGLSAGAEPVTATFWLLDAPDSLANQSRREPDGTGLGWFDTHHSPRVAKQALAAYEDHRFATEARAVRSTTFVSHIRFASTGALTLRNTHPFEQDGRLFAHNGVIEDLSRLDQRLGAAGRALVHGETDSERLFALITLEIARHGGDVAAGVKAAVRWVSESLPLLSANFVLAAPGELWALRYPETHELLVLERRSGGAGASADAALEQRSSHGTHVRAEQAAERPTVVIATERMDADPGWRPIPSGTLLHVGADLAVTEAAVVEHPPVHPLTLADLADRAKSSQS